MTARCFLVFACTLSAVSAEKAQTWRRWELTLHGRRGTSDVSVVFHGPAGQQVKAPAFRTAGGFRVRMAFPQPGDWTWEAAGAEPQHGRVEVEAYKGRNPLYLHGFLRVAKNGHYLEHADGTPFLWLGDTAWFALTRATDEEWHEYIGIRARSRFSVIQVSALGTWPGVLPPSVPIPKPFDASGGPDPAHWDRIETRVQAANERGLAVLMVGLARPPTNDDLKKVATVEYGREIAARFFGDHIMFSPDFDKAYEPLFDRVAENLRAYTSIHLITQHPNTQTGQNDLYVPKEYLSFSGLQSGHHSGKLDAAYTAAREWPIRLRGLKPTKPVINIEAMYDGRGNDEGPAWRVQDARKLGWISWLSGALGYTYGCGESERKVQGSRGGIWGFNQNPGDWDYWRKAIAWPSAGQMTILRDFLAGIAWWRLEPAPDQVRSELKSPQDRPLLTIADDRSFAVGYLPVAGVLGLEMSVFPGPMKAEWLNPRNGSRITAGDVVANRGLREFAAPEQRDDWVLFLRAR